MNISQLLRDNQQIKVTDHANLSLLNKSRVNHTQHHEVWHGSTMAKILVKNSCI